MEPTREWLNQPGGLTERLRAIRQAAALTPGELAARQGRTGRGAQRRLTGDELAARLGWPRTKVVKAEGGRTLLANSDLEAWARTCGQPEAIPDLLDMAAAAAAVHWQWTHKLRRGHVALQEEYDALIRGANQIFNFEIFAIPGLLQTHAYARALIVSDVVRVHGETGEDPDVIVAARMRRQDVLWMLDKTFIFIVTAAALEYYPCPPHVMRAQLDRLALVADLPNVTVGIIPPQPNMPVIPVVGFLTADKTTIVETFTSEDTIPGAESEVYGRIAERLLAESVTGPAAQQLITAAAARLPAA